MDLFYLGEHHMSEKIVTIGLCVRNAEKTLRETMGSIMKQDFPYELMEIVCVEDGSSDGTLSIIQENALKSDISITIFHINSRGLGHARNVVANNAQGRYIIWVDGDMILPKDHVQKQVMFMEKNPNVGIARSRYHIPSKRNLIEFLEFVPVMVDDFENKNINFRLFATSGAIFRLEAAKQVGGFDEAFNRVGEDWDIAYRIKSNGWSLKKSDTFFHEKRENSWKVMFNKYYWYGHGNYILHKKNVKILDITHTRILMGLIYSYPAYRLTGEKSSFILPLYFFFTSIAWWFGFIIAAISRASASSFIGHA